MGMGQRFKLDFKTFLPFAPSDLANETRCPGKEIKVHGHVLLIITRPKRSAAQVVRVDARKAFGEALELKTRAETLRHIKFVRGKGTYSCGPAGVRLAVYYDRI